MTKKSMSGASLKLFIYGLLAALLLTAASCDNSKETQKNIVSGVKQSGTEESKLIAYSFEHLSKRRLEKNVSKSEGMLSSLFSKALNAMNAQIIEAQLVAKVQLGVDLKYFGDTDVKVKDKRITVRLPELIVISTELDFDQSFVDSQKEGWLVSKTDARNLLKELYSKHIFEIKQEILKDAETVKKTRRSVEKTFTKIISAVAGDEFDIIFKYD